MSDFYNKYYDFSVTDQFDELSLRKLSGSDECYLQMTANGNCNGKITLTSKDMVEILQFLLSQMLEI